MNLVLISGSPRKVSLTCRVALHLKKRIEDADTGHHLSFIDLRDHVLPFIQQVYRTIDEAPPEHKELAKTIFNAEAFIIVSPEYNGGYSPALKNMFDHFPKQSRKPFGIATASDGRMGGMRAAQQLLQLVPALGGIASPLLLVTPVIDKKFGEDGELLDEGFSKSIESFLREFFWLAETLTTGKG